MTGLDSSALDSSDLAPLLALNNANARELSWLESARFAALVGRACLARRIGRADALVLAFDQDADYDGLDYLYFRPATGVSFTWTGSLSPRLFAAEAMHEACITMFSVMPLITDTPKSFVK